jgi:hypothetical protein
MGMPTSFRVIGYVTGIIVKAVEEGVVYLLSLTSLTGEEFVVRLRRPPEWLVVGAPISGTLVKVDEYYQVQDLTEAETLKPARPVEVESLELTKVGKGDGVDFIATGSSGGVQISAPILSTNIYKKAEKLRNSHCVLYVADLPTGSKIVAVQTLEEYRRSMSLKRFLNMVSEYEE